MANLGLTQSQAIAWLDCNTPLWRIAKANRSDERVHIISEGDELDDN